MEENRKAPAFLFYKSNFDIIQDYTHEERGKLFTALFIYAQTKEMPKDFPRDLLTCFKLFKAEIDKNEERYKEKLKRNKDYYESKRGKQTTPPEPTEEPPGDKPPAGETKPIKKQTSPESPKNEPKQGNLTQEQKDFLKELKKICPNKPIDCDLSEYPELDLKALLKAIKESPQFLKSHDNLSLQWIINRASAVISGTYRQHKTDPPPKRTDEEIEKQFENVKTFEGGQTC